MSTPTPLPASTTDTTDMADMTDVTDTIGMTDTSDMTGSTGSTGSTGPVDALDTACPRCGGGFHCGVNEGWCACFGTRLGEGLRRELAARWPDRCLCLRCLGELARGDPDSHVPDAPNKPPEPPLLGV